MSNNIILIHPMNAPEGQSFPFEQANKMLAREKIHKAGWKLKRENDRTQSNSGKVKETSKEGNDNQSAGSRG